MAQQVIPVKCTECGMSSAYVYNEKKSSEPLVCPECEHEATPPDKKKLATLAKAMSGQSMMAIIAGVGLVAVVGGVALAIASVQPTTADSNMSTGLGVAGVGFVVALVASIIGDKKRSVCTF